MKSQKVILVLLLFSYFGYGQSTVAYISRDGKSAIDVFTYTVDSIDFQRGYFFSDSSKRSPEFDIIFLEDSVFLFPYKILSMDMIDGFYLAKNRNVLQPFAKLASSKEDFIKGFLTLVEKSDLQANKFDFIGKRLDSSLELGAFKIENWLIRASFFVDSRLIFIDTFYHSSNITPRLDSATGAAATKLCYNAQLDTYWLFAYIMRERKSVQFLAESLATAEPTFSIVSREELIFLNKKLKGDVVSGR